MELSEDLGLTYVYIATITILCVFYIFWQNLPNLPKQIFPLSWCWFPWKLWFASVPGPKPSIISPFQKVNFFGRSFSQKYGTVYRIWHHATPVLVLGDPDAIRLFYRDHFAHKREADFTSAGCIFKQMMGECLGVAHGKEKVKSYRGLFEPFFSSSAAKNLQSLIGRAVDEWVASLNETKELDLYNCDMTDIAFKVLTTICYGEEAMWLHLDDMKRIFHLHGDAMSQTTAPFIDVPLWPRVSGLYEKAEKFNREWREFHQHLLRERANGIIKCCDGIFFELWDGMGDGTCPLTEKQLLQTLDEILLFNVDISQAATAFFIADISRHQHVQRCLLEEIDSTIGIEDIALVDDLVTKMPYLHNVMKESARMWPALALTFPEKTVKDITQINGYSIPKDTVVCIDPYTINYNPTCWPDPDTFKPERFSKDAKQPVNPNAFFRFGLGPRKCLGYRIALTTIAVTAVKLLQKYELRLTNEDASNGVKQGGMSFFTPYLAPGIILKSIN